MANFNNLALVTPASIQDAPSFDQYGVSITFYCTVAN